MTSDRLKTTLLHLAIAAALAGADALVLGLTDSIKNGVIAIPATLVATVLALLAVVHTEIQSAEQPAPNPAPNPAPVPPAPSAKLVWK